MTSQTPEEREIEEVVKEFYKIFDTDNLWQGEDEWTKNVPIGNIEQWLRTTLHHQLQKAREEERERIFEAIDDFFIGPNIILDGGVLKGYIREAIHSELDQDTELLNSVKEDWDKQAKNAMNGLDQDVSK